MLLDELLDGRRYCDVEVTRCEGRTLHAVVDGEPVEVVLPAGLAAEVHAVWGPETSTLRVAQADPMSLPISDGDGGVTHPETGWLVVSNPRVETTRAVGLLGVASVPVGYARGLTPEEIARFPNLCRLIGDVSSDGGQSSSRNGATIDAFQVHHMAMLSGRGALDAYSAMVRERRREVSSNLGIGGGRVRRIVNLMRRAWTSGSASMDARAITVETANSSGAPDWRVAEEDKALLGRVAAAMKLDLRWQSLVDRIYRHRDMLPRWGVSYATACPVDLTVADITARAERALRKEQDMPLTDEDVRKIWTYPMTGGAPVGGKGGAVVPTESAGARLRQVRRSTLGLHARTTRIEALATAQAAALEAMARAKGIDPAVITRTVDKAVRDALRGIEITLTTDD